MNSATGSNGTAAASHSGKYLIFALGAECYGLPVLRVREIIRYIPPTGIPQLPPHIKGVINLRGRVIPVVDLRLKFGLPAEVSGDRICIIVVHVTMAGQGQKLMAIIVDGVEEVIQVAPGDIEETPDFGAGLNVDYILGMARVHNTVKTLLDIDRVLAGDAVDAVPAG